VRHRSCGKFLRREFHFGPAGDRRAVIRMRLREGEPPALVAVAAILVASIRLHLLDVLLHLRWPGPNEMPCAAEVRKGQELGWLEHGSTVIVFAPPGFTLVDDIALGAAHPHGTGAVAAGAGRLARGALSPAS